MPIYYNTEIVGSGGQFIIRELVQSFGRDKNILYSVFVILDGVEKHIKDFMFLHNAHAFIDMERRRESQWK